MKYVALMAVAFCVSFLGQYISKQLEMRIIKLEKIYVLLSDISSRIEFTADSVTDIFSSLSVGENYGVLPFVKDCETRLLHGEDFDSAWLSSLKNLQGLRKEDIEVLISFGASFGTTDIAGQKSNCEIHKKLIESKLQSAQADFKMYSKPAKGIGMLVGIAIFILFI